MRRFIGAAVALACLGLYTLAAYAPSAQANFEPISTFANSGVEALNGEGVAGVATNDTSGNVYVDDPRGHRVERFDAEGKFLAMWGWGIETGAEEFQTCETSCQAAGLAGTGVGQFERPQGVAVDQTTGDVYVLDPGRTSGVVQEFAANGAFIRAFGEVGESAEDIGLPAGNTNGVAVGPTGNVYVLDRGGAHGPRVMTFGATGNYLAGQDIGSGLLEFPASIAIDGSGDIVLVDKTCVVDKFTPSGELLWQTPEECEKQSLTVDPSSGGVFYYAKKGNQFFELNSAGESLRSFHGASTQEFTFGLAFNPNATLPGEHPPGILYAINFDEATEVAEGLIFAQAPIVPATVESESVSQVGSTSAKLEAQINPHGSDTHFHFQYGTSGPCAASACAETPSAPGDLGSAEAAVTAGVNASGLAPETTYHFRVVATNVAGPTMGPDETFRTFGTAQGLPDGSAYELVSPPEKHAGEVFPPEPNGGSCAASECKPGINEAPAPMQSADDGDSVAYVGFPFAVGSGPSTENQYYATRTKSGWQTQAISPLTLGEGEKQGYKWFSGDLSQGVLFTIRPTLTAEAPVGYANLYARESGTGAVRAMVATTPPHRSAGSGTANAFRILLAGVDATGAHAIFEANDTLTPPAVDGGANENNLYEWTSGGLTLVNVLSNGATTGPNAVFGSGRELTSGTGGNDFSHAISDDGARIYWTDQNTGQVYLREHATSTTAIPDAGQFLVASADGSRVLLNDDHLYDVDSKSLNDLTKGAGGFLGTLGASDDLSQVYFVDTAALEGHGAAGESNLYLWSEGALRFIGTLSPGDNTSWFLSQGSLASDWAASPSHRTAQVTPDGRYLALMSRAGLTGFDNTVHSGECSSNGGTTCFEVFEYDAATSHLACVSCSPAEQRPLGSSNLSLVKPGGQVDLPQPRNLADNGILFFDSLDVLSQQDTNGRVQDVYEYEPRGLGSCAGTGEGCLSMISTGHSASDSNFVTASPNGGNVFFTTRQQLVAEDQDELIDLYDARIGGGFTPPAVETPCSGEACRQQPAPGPTLSAPLSAGFAGSGNLAAPAPAAGQPGKPGSKPPTRAQKLAAALKVCRKKPRRKRAACKARARRKYGHASNAKKSAGARR